MAAFFRGNLHRAPHSRLCSNFSRLSHAALVNRQNPSADGLSYGSSVHVMQLIGAACSLTWASFLVLFLLAALSMFTSESVFNYFNIPRALRALSKPKTVYIYSVEYAKE